MGAMAGSFAWASSDVVAVRKSIPTHDESWFTMTSQILWRTKIKPGLPARCETGTFWRAPVITPERKNATVVGGRLD
jgi:hypothetical protein